MRFKEWKTPGQSDLFEIPSDCSQILVTGCGAGAGGGGSASATGAGGGAASPCVIRFPLTVTPNGVLAIYVGTPSVGGVGTASQSLSAGGFARHTGIVGRALVDLICAPTYPGLPFFIIGWGGESSNAYPCVPNYGYESYTAAPTNIVAGNPPQWVEKSVSNIWPWADMGPASMSDIGRAPPTNPYMYGLVGRNSINGNGYGISQVSDATYSSGGAGGGGAFGKGGIGGAYSGGSPHNGGDATGYGAAGGAGSGVPSGSSTGGAGSGGYLRFDY